MITHATILVAAAREGLHARLRDQEWPSTLHHNPQQLGLVRAWDYAGGDGEQLATEIYAAALAGVPGPELEEWFIGLPWDASCAAVLLWHSDLGELGRVSVNWRPERFRPSRPWIDQELNWRRDTEPR